MPHENTHLLELGAVECNDVIQAVVHTANDTLKMLDDGRVEILKEGVPFVLDTYKRVKAAIEGSSEIRTEIERIGLLEIMNAGDMDITEGLQFPPRFKTYEEIAEAWVTAFRSVGHALILTFWKNLKA